MKENTARTKKLPRYVVCYKDGFLSHYTDKIPLSFGEKDDPIEKLFDTKANKFIYARPTIKKDENNSIQLLIF